MSDKRSRAARGTQRERIIVHRTAILEMLKDGMMLGTILQRLDLADIPIQTFHHHVKRIRKDAEAVDMQIAPSETLTTGADISVTSAVALLAKTDSEAPRILGSASVNARPNRKLHGGYRTAKVGGDESTMNLNPAEWRKKYGDHT